MTKQDWQDEFLSTMLDEFRRKPAKFVIFLCRKLMSMSKSHCRFAVQDCNVGLTEDEKLREERLEGRIEKLCKEFHPRLKPLFGGDPRGCTLKLRLPSGKCTDFGGEGVCVPQ